MKVKERLCNDHPDAPHGFDRNASHNEGRYVCECESWEPDAQAEIAKRDERIKELETILNEACTEREKQQAAEISRLREVITKAAAHVRPTCSDLYKELQEALAAIKEIEK